VGDQDSRESGSAAMSHLKKQSQLAFVGRLCIWYYPGMNINSSDSVGGRKEADS